MGDMTNVREVTETHFSVLQISFIYKYFNASLSHFSFLEWKTILCALLLSCFCQYVIPTFTKMVQNMVMYPHISTWALNIFLAMFLCPTTKSGGVLCYTLRTFECLSVRLSVRPSAVEHSCPVHNFDTVRDNFTKLGTNINHDQTTCRD